MEKLNRKKSVGGWQVNVEYFKDYVIKTPKTETEIKERITNYLKARGGINKLERRVRSMQKDWKYSLKLVVKKNIPMRLLGYPEFLEDGKIKQKKVNNILGGWRGALFY